MSFDAIRAITAGFTWPSSGTPSTSITSSNSDCTVSSSWSNNACCSDLDNIRLKRVGQLSWRRRSWVVSALSMPAKALRRIKRTVSWTLTLPRRTRSTPLKLVSYTLSLKNLHSISTRLEKLQGWSLCCWSHGRVSDC